MIRLLKVWGGVFRGGYKAVNVATLAEIIHQEDIQPFQNAGFSGSDPVDKIFTKCEPISFETARAIDWDS